MKIKLQKGSFKSYRKSLMDWVSFKLVYMKVIWEVGMVWLDFFILKVYI